MKRSLEIFSSEYKIPNLPRNKNKATTTDVIRTTKEGRPTDNST